MSTSSESPSPNRHVFLSYSRHDGEEFALRLELALSNKGFITWRDKRGINPTHDFTSEIERAIESASHVVSCITLDTQRDNSFVRREIGYALVMKKPVVIARFVDVAPPISVVNNTWLDFFQGWEQAFSQLVEFLCQPTGTQAKVPLLGIENSINIYLERLYREIVDYLDTTVFALLSLQSRATPQAVRNVLPVSFWGTALLVVHQS